MQPVALVTGAGGGIGAEVCRALADSHRVLAGARDVSKVTEGEAVELDVTDAERSRAVIEEYAPDALVLNAGIAISQAIGKDGGEENLRRHLEVNFLGAARLIEAAVPGWKERGGGKAVVVASSAALVGYAYVSAYAASKHAILGYVRSAAHELARAGIQVNAVCPHYVDSPMTDASVARIVETTGRSTEEARATLAAQNPGGELVRTAEVAETVRSLLAGTDSGRVIELLGGGMREI